MRQYVICVYAHDVPFKGSPLFTEKCTIMKIPYHFFTVRVFNHTIKYFLAIRMHLMNKSHTASHLAILIIIKYAVMSRIITFHDKIPKIASM